MSEALLKAFRWWILAMCAVVGTSAFIISDATNSTKPVIIGILSYGLIYIMSLFWKEFRERVLIMSIAVFLLLSFLSPYVPDAMYVLFGYPQRLFDPYYCWAGLVTAFGIPIMSLVFLKYDD